MNQAQKFALTRIHEPTTGNEGIDARNVIVGAIYPWGTPMTKPELLLVTIVIGERNYLHVEKRKGTDPWHN